MSIIKPKKLHIVKVPKDVIVLHCNKKKLLSFSGPLQKKSFKVEVKIVLISSTNSILVTSLPSDHSLSSTTKHLKILQGTTFAKIKQAIVEVNYPMYSKLKFVGVGYRVFYIETMRNNFYFKLGCSHFIYLKLIKPLQGACVKSTELFIFGNSSYEKITKTVALIQDFKRPEPYKGKGILKHDQVTILKKGKKI